MRERLIMRRVSRWWRRLATLTVTAITLVLGASVPPTQAAFPGANGRIVFDDADSGSSDIYSVRPSGSGLKKLTDTPKGTSAWQPRVSADGRTVVYVVSTDGENDQLWVMRSDGTKERPLTKEPDWTHGGASFTPNGARIVYSRCGNYVAFYWTCRIVSVLRDGTGMRTIVGGTWHPNEAVISPDGSTVAHVSDRGGYDARLWLVDADGSNPRTIGPTFGVERLSWAPDGSRIAFTGDFKVGNIYTIATDGSDLDKVVRGPFAILPAWSPDGLWLVYLNGTTGELKRARIDGTHVSTVVTGDAVQGILFSDWGVAP
jgi:Tol biopolymer transport system component